MRIVLDVTDELSVLVAVLVLERVAESDVLIVVGTVEETAGVVVTVVGFVEETAGVVVTVVGIVEETAGLVVTVVGTVE